MSETFPRLKTGALTQYPVARELTRPVAAVRFLDLGRQVYLDCRESLRRWRLSFSLLDESELQDVIEFFVAMRGSLGRFDFEDPATGEIVANCRFAEDELLLASVAEFDGRTELTVTETR